MVAKRKQRQRRKLRSRSVKRQRLIRRNNVDHLEQVYLLMTSQRLTGKQQTLLERALGPGVTMVNMEDIEDGETICLVDDENWTVTKNGNWFRYREDNIIELYWA
tara:strand:- start:439 stop:753 length:315 start_codon:yes stop_codon:yes gene_type:complete